MDILNSIKEWASNIFGDATSNVTESLNMDGAQQQIDETTQSVTDVVEQAQDTLDSLSKQ